MKRAIVKSMIAPLYVQPKHGELDDEALYGMVLEVLEELPNLWYRIRTPYQYVSYVEGKHLCFDDAELFAYETGDLHTVYAPAADLLDGENFQNFCLFTVTKGACVNVIQEGTPWTKLRLIGGETAFVRSSHLGTYHRTQNGDEAAFRKSVTEAARKFLGTQYRWGGRTPVGIDCSGLASECYLLNGVAIYRNADIKEGFPLHEITREQMKEGDLLFFEGHVALYIGGDRYIHSTGRAGADGVVINSLNPAHPDYREDLEKGILKIGSIF